MNSKRPLRPLAMLVTSQGLSLQRDGQSQYLRSWSDYLTSEGYRVVIVVPTAQSGELMRRSTGDSPDIRFIDQKTVRLGKNIELHVAGPKTMLFSLSWKGFERLPARLQRQIDQLRSKRRAKHGVDYVVGSWPGDHQLDYLATMLRQHEPDLMVSFMLFAAPRPGDIPSSTIAIMAAEESMSDRIASMEARGFRCMPQGLTASVEAEHLSKWSTIVAIQWDEQVRLQELVPTSRVFVVPYAREDQTPDVSGTSVRNPTESTYIAFVGTGASTNVDAVRWFLENCWPEISNQNPGLEFHVIGSVCWRLSVTGPRVVLRGFVDDLDAAVAEAAVTVVPLQAGTGLKVKMIDAMAAGAAIVTTPIGAQGLGSIEPPPFVVAEDAASFVKHVNRLLLDEGARQSLGSHALLAAQRFTPSAAFRELREFLVEHGLPVRTPETGDTEDGLLQETYCDHNRH
jgi:glycosyltransferase involved in cell wall biosynthesis